MRFIGPVGTGRAALCAAVLVGVLAGPVSGASASDASIKAVIESYNSKILVSEGRVVSAIGKFKRSGNPKDVQAALQKATAVLGSLKSRIAAQSASGRRVKLGKTKLEQGLQKVIVAYRRLERAFGEKQVSPAAAKAEAKKAVLAVNAGRVDLREGVKLLG
jgi:hypothetical protein